MGATAWNAGRVAPPRLVLFQLSRSACFWRIILGVSAQRNESGEDAQDAVEADVEKPAPASRAHAPGVDLHVMLALGALFLLVGAGGKAISDDLDVSRSALSLIGAGLVFAPPQFLVFKRAGGKAGGERFVYVALNEAVTVMAAAMAALLLFT